MEQDTEWSIRLAKRIGARVALYRTERKMTAQALADRCSDLGHALDRSVIAKLEKGHRQTVTVADVIVLARALRVPPIMLIYPIGDESNVEVLPGTDAETWDAAKWFMGTRPHPERETPDHPQPDDYEGLTTSWQTSSWALRDFLLEDDLRLKHMLSKGDARSSRAAAVKAVTDEDRHEYEERAKAAEIVTREIENSWRRLRNAMRDRGVVPQTLRPDYAAIIDGQSPSREDAD